MYIQIKSVIFLIVSTLYIEFCVIPFNRRGDSNDFGKKLTTPVNTLKSDHHQFMLKCNKT